MPLPDSACSSQSMNFFICDIKTDQPLGEWLSLYHFRMTSSDNTSAENVRELIIFSPIIENNRRLTLVEEEDDLVEVFEKVLVVVAVLLDLVEQDHLALGARGERREERNVDLEMFETLLRHQVLLLVPLHVGHD